MVHPWVLLSELDLDHNTLRLQNHLENKGYFRAKVTGDTVVRRKKARATYQAEAGPHIKLQQFIFLMTVLNWFTQRFVKALIIPCL